MDEAIILTGKQIPLARLITMRAALKLELMGMKRRGQSMYSILKEELGIKGNKQSVLSQLEKHIAKEKLNGNS